MTEKDEIRKGEPIEEDDLENVAGGCILPAKPGFDGWSAQYNSGRDYDQYLEELMKTYGQKK